MPDAPPWRPHAHFLSFTKKPPAGRMGVFGTQILAALREPLLNSIEGPKASGFQREVRWGFGRNCAGFCHALN